MDDIELPLVPVLRAMEVEGVRLNVERLEAVGRRVRDEVAALEREIWDLCGTEFTIGSPQQLGEVLFNKLGLSRKRRGKTGFSTDARVLQAIRDEHPVVPRIERWRELNQLVKTYLDVLPQLVDERGRIHTTFLQAVATTGRLASTNPNLQNVPVRTELGREIRGCFEAQEGSVLISVDYSQVELRILAHVADEPSSRRSSCGRGRAHRDGLPGLRQGRGGPHADGPLEGQDDQLRHRLRAERLRPRRPAQHPARGGKAFIDAYLERFPPCTRS